MFLVHLIFVALVAGTHGQRCVPANCRLPDCNCPWKTPPPGIERTQVPQIVMFTFDDALNGDVYSYFRRLFQPQRVNPNGCPISATFFVSHNDTDYQMVRDLYQRGHEVASHSITHKFPQSWWTWASYENLAREFVGQRNNLVSMAGIPESEIRGIRVPFLEIGGDTQLQMMQDFGFLYDASVYSGPHDEGGNWPYTFDYPPRWDRTICDNNNCPASSFPGIWEVPLNRWYSNSGQSCTMTDDCSRQPASKQETLSYLWQNFNRHYHGNKAPVGVNMHGRWFHTKHHLDAMDEFVHSLSEMEDVYILTVYQTIQYMRNPSSLRDVQHWQSWRTTCYAYDSNRL